jgi:methyl coenzyme M reductase beta subunit
MSYVDWSGFRIEHCHAQQVSYATLLDERGNFVKDFAPLEADGHDHADAIYRVIDDYWLAVADRLSQIRQSLAAVETLKDAAA